MKQWQAFLVGCAVLGLSACGGGGSPAGGSGNSPPPPPATYNLGGTVTGLSSAELVLINGSDMLPVASGAGSFTFDTALASGVGGYGAQITLTPDFDNPRSVAIDGAGLPYVVDSGAVWQLSP